MIEAIRAWARSREDVRGVAVVGSWGRREGRMSSDLDLVVIANDAAVYTGSSEWALELGATGVVGTRRWGVLTERCLVMPSGLELDVGFVPPSWAATAPLDEGTVRVVSGGIVVAHDPDDLLRQLLHAVAARRGDGDPP